MYPDHFSIVNGSTNSDADAIVLKANNRRYKSQGVQTKFDIHWAGTNVFHDLEIGLRYHYDEEDRFQWKDGYNIINGEMNLTSAGPGGSDANRAASMQRRPLNGQRYRSAAECLFPLRYNPVRSTQCAVHPLGWH
mgnify:CR=1 FL=1